MFDAAPLPTAIDPPTPSGRSIRGRLGQAVGPPRSGGSPSPPAVDRPGQVKSDAPGVNRAAQALRMAAQSLHHSRGALGGFLRRMKGRLGAQAAVTATAHKLARIVYLALKHGLTYVRQSQEEYEARMREKQIKALRRKARQLGLEVVEKTSGNVATAGAASVEG